MWNTLPLVQENRATAVTDTKKKPWQLLSEAIPHPVGLVSYEQYQGLILHASTGCIVIYNSNLYLSGYLVCYQENNKEMFEDKIQ